MQKHGVETLNSNRDALVHSFSDFVCSDRDHLAQPVQEIRGSVIDGPERFH